MNIVWKEDAKFLKIGESSIIIEPPFKKYLHKSIRKCTVPVQQCLGIFRYFFGLY